MSKSPSLGTMKNWLNPDYVPKGLSKAEYRTGVKGVTDLFTEPLEEGGVKIMPFELKDVERSIENMRQIRDGGLVMGVHDGKYVRLVVDGELMMSDTAMERYSNKEFIKRATGKVLIAGLGIGLIIRNIIDKPDVESILIVENNQAVIDLVLPRLPFSNKIRVIKADIFEFNKAIKGQKFDTIYFDIWPRINTDNLDEIKKLHNKFKFNLNRANPRAWMDSWMKEYLLDQRRRDKQNHY